MPSVAFSQRGTFVFFTTEKSKLTKAGPRKRLRPWANVTLGPLQGPFGPGRFPVLNPVSQPVRTKSAPGLGVEPSLCTSGGRHGTRAAGMAAPFPHGPEGPRGATGTEKIGPKKFLLNRVRA